MNLDGLITLVVVVSALVVADVIVLSLVLIVFVVVMTESIGDGVGTRNY